MVKVVHVSTFHLSGGAGLAASRLNRSLNKHGLASNLLVAKSSGEEKKVSALDHSFLGRSFFWARFIAERVFFLPYERDPSVRYVFSPAVSGIDLTGHPLIKEADVIHLHWVNFGLLSLHNIQQLLDLGKPVVWTLHDMWAFTGGCHYSGDCQRYLEACGNCGFLKKPGTRDLSFRRLQVKERLWTSSSKLNVIGCSKWLADLAQSSNLFESVRVRNIPNPIDSSVFRPTERLQACTELGLSSEKRYLLFAAAKVSSKLKGFDYLKDALNILTLTEPDLSESLELLVIGGGEQNLLDGLPLKAHFLGYVSGDENLVRIYNAASLYVTPSVEDNLPNTVMEALACGTPVVGFNTGGIPEMIEHKCNGFVADYKSAASLAEGMAWVIRHDTEGRLSTEARQKVLREYDEKVVASRYLGLYREILKG